MTRKSPKKRASAKKAARREGAAGPAAPRGERETSGQTGPPPGLLDGFLAAVPPGRPRGSAARRARRGEAGAPEQELTRFARIHVVWIGGPQLDELNRLTAGLSSPTREELARAAQQTSTGRRAGELRMGAVLDVPRLEGTPGRYTRVEVVFGPAG